MSRKSRRAPFRGPLAEPIAGQALYDAFAKIRTENFSPEDIEQFDSLNHEIQVATHRKLLLLANHYGFDTQMSDEIWLLLTLTELARDFVPGFRVDPESATRPARGRPKTTPPEMLAEFEALRASGMSAGDAMKKLKRDDRWKGKVPAGLNARLSEAQRRRKS